MNTLYNTYSIGGLSMFYDKKQGRNEIQRKPQGNQRSSNKQKDIRTPRADLFETNDYYYIRLSLPGVKKENLTIKLDDKGVLEIRGKVITNLPEHTKNIIHQEIYQGPFYRKINLSSKVDKQSINFKYNNGILDITIKK